MSGEVLHFDVFRSLFLNTWDRNLLEFVYLMFCWRMSKSHQNAPPPSSFATTHRKQNKKVARVVSAFHFSTFLLERSWVGRYAFVDTNSWNKYIGFSKLWGPPTSPSSLVGSIIKTQMLHQKSRTHQGWERFCDVSFDRGGRCDSWFAHALVGRSLRFEGAEIVMKWKGNQCVSVR